MIVIKFNDADNSAFVGIDAPATVSGSYTLTLPAGVGSASQALAPDFAPTSVVVVLSLFCCLLYF